MSKPAGKKARRPYFIFCENGHEYPQLLHTGGDGVPVCSLCCAPVRLIRLPKSRIAALRAAVIMGGVQALVDLVAGYPVPKLRSTTHYARLMAHNARVGYDR